MKAKINMAVDHEGKYVKIQEAVRGQEYFCLNCKEKLIPSMGNKNIHHFRHFNKKDRAALIECELYSSDDSDYEVLLNEQSYENRFRFIIDQSYNLKIRLPYLKSTAFSRMNVDDLYFNVQILGESVFSSDLGQKSKVRYVDIPLQHVYNVQVDKKKNAKLLNYEVQAKIPLFQNKVLLFKKMNGEFINIPYQKTNLSDEFYLMSTTPLVMTDELTLLNQLAINEIYIYHFCFENLTDSLINWFRKETGYIVVPNRKWIDLIYPYTFQYSDNSIIIDEERIQLKITEFSRADIFTIIDHTGKIINLKTDEKGFLEFELKLDHIYNFQLNNELCNELTIKRVSKIHPTSNYKPSVQVDNQPYDFIGINTLYNAYSVEAELYFQVYMEFRYPFRSKEIRDILPRSIHIPYLGTIHRKPKPNSDELLNLTLFTNQERYIVVKNSEFLKIVKIIKKTKLPNKVILINTLLKQYNKLPEGLVKNIREGIL